MPEAVVFDWFGTLACFAHGASSQYEEILAAKGYRLDVARFDAYQAAWNGVEHREHSVSRSAYLSWMAHRLEGLARDCGVADAAISPVVAELVASEGAGEMVAFSEVPAVLSDLRNAGLSIGVCSNWGWDLDPYLEATGVAPLLDAAVTSARAGYRKPHPGIYQAILDRLGVRPAQALFVGDSWEPDVIGPLAAGMGAVHLLRDPSRPAPALPRGAARVTSLEGLAGLGLVPTRG